MPKPICRVLRVATILISCLACHGWAESGTNLQWSTESTNRFVSVHGRRSAIFGYPETGAEIWAYPFQIVKSLQVSFRPQGGSSEMSGRELLRRVIYSPETTTRVYTGPDFVIREELFVPLDEPGAIISYEVDAERPVDIVVRFTPVLDLMWPASIGGQEAVWSSPLSSYVISEPLHRFTAIIGSTDIVAHDDTQNYNRNLNLSQGLAFTLRVEPHKTGRLVIAGDNSETALKAAAQQLRSHHDALLNSYVKHDSDLLRHTLQVETPDDEVNRALAWAEIALDQAWVCNPDLGCAEVGGYGPSRKARRPQYDWFFAGDGMAAVQALLADGSYDQARQELEFILKYQNPKTGMIWHELSQSAAWLDWKSYPYLFLHVDLTYEFLIAVRDYLSRTGDLDFAKSHWDAIQLAYQYCRSLIDPLTGLPQIPSEKRGEREQEELSDELALSANWMMASKAFATLAEATGHSDLAQLSTSQQLGQTILHRYWDEKQHAWISGYTRSGSPLPLRGIGPVGLLEELPLTQEQRDSVLDELASANFQTDWGTRGNGSEAANYAPNSYASGSVWAITTSGAATAFWNQHRPTTAFPIWSALVPWSSLDSIGHMHEALAGDFYHEELESVPEQTFSSAAFFTSAVNGLLGLQPDAAKHQLTFAPHLPANWATITLRQLRIGDSQLSLIMNQSAGKIALEIQNDGPPVHFTFSPEIPVGAKLKFAKLADRKIVPTLEQHPQDTHATLHFDLPHGHSTLVIDILGGVTIIPDLPTPMVGDSSHALKIISTTLQAGTYTVDLDQMPSVRSGFDVRTPLSIRNVEGATAEKVSPGLYRFTVTQNRDAQDKATCQRGRVTFKVSSAHQD